MMHERKLVSIFRQQRRLRSGWFSGCCSYSLLCDEFAQLTLVSSATAEGLMINCCGWWSSGDPITAQSYSLHICNICRRLQSWRKKPDRHCVGWVVMINRYLSQSIGNALLALSPQTDRHRGLHAYTERDSEKQTAVTTLSVAWWLSFYTRSEHWFRKLYVIL